MISKRNLALCALLLAGVAGLSLRPSPVEAESVATPTIKPLGFAAEMPSKDIITNAIPRGDALQAALHDCLLHRPSSHPEQG